MMKKMRMQIHRPQSLLTFGVVVLMATLIWGVQLDSTTESGQQLKIPSDVQGAVVLDLHPASAAAQAGLRPGDVIQSINRQEVRDAGEASRLTQNAKEKRTLLRVWSNSGSHFVLIEDLEPWNRP